MYTVSPAFFIMFVCSIKLVDCSKTSLGRATFLSAKTLTNKE